MCFHPHVYALGSLHGTTNVTTENLTIEIKSIFRAIRLTYPIYSIALAGCAVPELTAIPCPPVHRFSNMGERIIASGCVIMLRALGIDYTDLHAPHIKLHTRSGAKCCSGVKGIYSMCVFCGFVREYHFPTVNIRNHLRYIVKCCICEFKYCRWARRTLCLIVHKTQFIIQTTNLFVGCWSLLNQ